MAPIKIWSNDFENGDAASLFAPWSFVHMGSGILAGGISAFYVKYASSDIDTLVALWLFAVLAWEVFEHVGYTNNADGIFFTFEHSLNKLTDIALGLLGFTFMLWATRVDVVDS